MYKTPLGTTQDIRMIKAWSLPSGVLYIKLKSPEIMYAVASKQINDQSLHMYSKNLMFLE